MKNNTLIMVILAVLVGGALGYLIGTKYPNTASNNRYAGFQNGQRGNFGQRGGSRPIVGQVIGQDDKSITIKLQDGSSKIIILTDTTSFSKSTAGSKSDLQTGERVAVLGKQNSDGSETAQNVQINPSFRGLMNYPSGSPR